MSASEREQSTRPETDEELRDRLEEELRKVRVEEVVLQSVVSIVNLTARRIAKEDERDLAQAKVGIDAVRALVEVLPTDAAKQIRAALSELQMLYAREAGGGEAAGGEERQTGEGGGADAPPARGAPSGEPPPRLWTPPGSN
jgi:hypothetical protein